MITEAVLKEIESLSPRQYQIFCWMGEGRSPSEVAHMPGHNVARKTVDTICDHIKSKLSLDDVYKVRALATRYLIYIETNKIVRLETKAHFIHQRLCSS